MTLMLRAIPSNDITKSKIIFSFQVASAETFFGGDILGLLEAIEKMTDKMRRDLEQVVNVSQ